MNKEFIPYKQALELKELGFNEGCFGYYYTLNGKDWKFAEKSEYYRLDDEINIGGKFSLLAPLYQQAFRWFREKYQIDSHIKKDEIDDVWYGYEAIIECEDDFADVGTFNTYEEAVLACLNKLIEIIKNKFGGLEK
jgi:hypothetical protein